MFPRNITVVYERRRGNLQVDLWQRINEKRDATCARWIQANFLWIFLSLSNSFLRVRRDFNIFFSLVRCTENDSVRRLRRRAKVIHLENVVWGCQLCKISVIRVDLSGELIFDRLREAELLRVGEFEFFFWPNDFIFFREYSRERESDPFLLLIFYANTPFQISISPIVTQKYRERSRKDSVIENRQKFQVKICKFLVNTIRCYK